MLQLHQLAELRTMYPEIKTGDFKQFLSGIEKDTLMRVATHLIGNDLQSNNDQDNKSIIEEWFSSSNKQFAQDASNRLEKYLIENGKPLKIVSVISCLRILQFGLDLEEKGMLNSKSKEESEIHLFYALLHCNQNEDYNQTKDIGKIKAMFPKNEYAAIMLNYSFPIHDITNYRLPEYTECQIIKALLLFLFLDTTSEGSALVKRFCEYYGIANWKEYFERALPIISAWAKRDKASSVDLILDNKEKYEESRMFLEKLAMNDYVQLEDIDYIKLRERPLIQLDQSTFRIIHPLFISDKIYKGIYFLLNQLNREGLQIINNFRSWYTTNFSENVCFREIIKFAITKHSVLYFDDDLRRFSVNGPPDCYLRIDNNLFLFENKDILISAGIKSGYNFEALIVELKRKLLVEEARPVGIGQLITNIKKLFTKENSFDKGLYAERVLIYPILVVHDYMFDPPALNRILNIFFQEELAKLQGQGLEVHRVKPLVILNIDALIEVSSLLKNEKITLNELFEAFYENSRCPKKEKYRSWGEFEDECRNSLLSFTNFIVHFLASKFGRDWKTDELLEYLFHKGRLS